jgi:hypothetical protein
MRTLRSPIVGVLILVAATLAACGSGQESDAGATATQAGTTVGGVPTNAPVTTPTPEPSSSEGAESSGASSGDVKALADALKPPNATQTFTSEASGLVTTIYASTDSADSLKSFYDGAIADAGMKVISTSTDTTTSTTAIVFASEDNATFGGSIAISPDPSGSGTNVSVIVGGSM